MHNVLIARTLNEGDGAVDFQGTSLVAENVTADFGFGFFEAENPYGTASLTNCLVTRQSLKTVYSESVTVQTNLTVCITNPTAPVYQTIGAGSYYLTNGSPYHNLGTANISPSLLAELRQKTTYPPIVFSNITFSVATNFSPQAPRDTNAAPDLGYHYDPLDYAFGGVNANSNINYAAGTAVGWFELPGSFGNGYGISITNGSAITFNGTATADCYFVRYSMVQEGGNGNWPDKSYPGGIVNQTTYDETHIPLLRATFTRFTHFEADSSHFRDGSSGQPLAIQLTDCELLNTFGGYNILAALTNCLLDRVTFWQGTGNSYPYEIYRNCTFHGGEFDFVHWESGAPYWYSSFRNCAFDGTGFSIDDPFGTNVAYADYNYDAFLQGAAEPPTEGANTVAVTNFNWQTSWFGNYYLPTNSALINVGSTNANLFGLYHFTTQTNQVKETNSIVDIGYHYVATDSYGNPIDSNGDGIPDYLEDANGNGLVDAGETNWAIAILVQPVNQTATQSSNATFSVTASGVNPLHYQWYFNATNALAGATNASLTLYNVQTTNAGYYSVVVTNTITSTNSVQALLTVTPLISFSNFCDSSLLSINGNAFTTNTPTDGCVLELTPALANQHGSAFCLTPISLLNNASFSSYFKFRMSPDGGPANANGIVGADGFVFVVQTLTNNVGGSGGGLGYLNVTNSVGVEFDTHWNDGHESDFYTYPSSDPLLPGGATNPDGSHGDNNHIGIDFNGFITNTLSGPVQMNGSIYQHIDTPLNNGILWNAWVDYNGGTSNLEVRVSTNSIRPDMPSLATTVNLLDFLKVTNAYVGFTASTGGGYQHHDILSWQFTPFYQPIGVSNISVMITSPSNQTFLARTIIPISVLATSSIPGVTISGVQIFWGTNGIGTNYLGGTSTSTNGIYQIYWPPVFGGKYVFTALATDSRASNFLSAPVTNTVWSLPTVSIINPTNSSVFLNSPTNILIQAYAVADASTIITNVMFYRGTNVISTTTNGLANVFSITNSMTNGTYVLRAKAYDTNGGISFSTNVIITIATNEPPSVFAGLDQTNNLSTNVIQLNGLVSDDGLPNGILSVTWTNLSGTTNVVIAITNQPLSYAYFYATGVYNLNLSATDGQYTNNSTTTITILQPNLPPVVSAGTNQIFILPAVSSTNLIQPVVHLSTLTSVDGIGGGIDYFAPSNCAIFSVFDYSDQLTAHLDLLPSSGSPINYVSISNAVVGFQYGTDEAYIATVKSTLGGFQIGEIFFGNNINNVVNEYTNDCEVMRINPDGSNQWTNGTYSNAWLVITNTPGTVHSLWVDETGMWGGNLLVLTGDGSHACVWRIDSTGKVSEVVSNIQADEGIVSIPNDINKYGPWAGRILVGGDEGFPISAIDTNGNVAEYNLGIGYHSILGSENIHVIPPNANLLCVVDATVYNPYDYSIYGVPASEITASVGDILVADEQSNFYKVHWNGANFEVALFNDEHQVWAEANFTPEPLFGLSTNFVQLNGCVQDDGHIINPTTNLWIKVSGPGTVTFGDPELTNTYALFSDTGTYYLRLSANDGQFERHADTRIDVIRNQSPSVNAGTNQIVATTNASLAGIVTDDGWPDGQLSVSWFKISGPGSVLFNWTNQILNLTNVLATNYVSFSLPGTYVLGLTGDDGQAANTAIVTITTAATNLTLSPSYAWPTLTDTLYSVTATVEDQTKVPLASVTVQFVTTGANAATNLIATDTNGVAILTYSGKNSGRDEIIANIVGQTNLMTAIKDWAEEIDCGSDITFAGTASSCLSWDWPINTPHYSDYYIYGATAGSNLNVRYESVNNVLLVVRDCSNNVVTIGGSGYLSYVPLLSTNYLLELTDIVTNELPSYRLTLACGTNSPDLTAPEMEVACNGTNILNGSTLFFPVTTQGAATHLTLVFSNSGSSMLQIIASTNYGGDFCLSNNLSGASLEALTATNLDLRFIATSNEVSIGELFLVYNATDQYVDYAARSNNFIIYLLGEAFATGAPPSIQITDPTTNATFYAPANVLITALVTPGVTNVNSVIFQELSTNGPVTLGSVSVGVSNVYNFNWANVPDGTYSITGIAVDADGRSITAAPVSVQVLPTNGSQPPVAVNHNFTVFANSYNNVLNVLAYDFDTNGDALKIISVTRPGNGGTATIVNGGTAISYTPAHGFSSTDTSTGIVYPGDGFSYSISDGHGGTASAMVSVGIFAAAIPVVNVIKPITSGAGDYGTNVGAVVPIVAQVAPTQYITRVEFYLGNVLIGSVTNGPNGLYTNLWTASFKDCDCGFTATACDAFGQVGTSQPIYITNTPPINGPGGTSIGPVAAISMYAAGTNVAQAFTNLVTIRDGVFALSGQAYHPLGSNDVVWQLGIYSQDGQTLLRDLTPQPLINTDYHAGTIGSTVSAAILVTNCDLTTLQNGVYTMRLVVMGGLMITNTDIQFILDSSLKIGQFSFSQQDLVIPVNGIPLTVTRTYNSLDPDIGEFGYSWTYALNDMDVQLDETREQDSGWNADALAYQEFSQRVNGGRDVTLTLPNGQRTTFYYSPNHPDGYSEYPAWVAAAGVTAKLTAQYNPHYDVFYQQWVDSSPDASDDLNVPYGNYDIPGFILTTHDGTQYIINRQDLGAFEMDAGYTLHAWGAPYLAQIIQRNQDTIAIDPGGVTFLATNGVTRQIIFNRDSTSGLITSISDPNGSSSGPPAIKYEYDGFNNLMNVERLVDSNALVYVTNSFLYTNPNFPHYITSMINGDGTQVAQNFYDDSGKLIAVQDADGNRTQFVHNLTNDTEVVVDRLEHTNIYIYDTRGNVTVHTNALGQVTTMAYDFNNNKTNETVFLNSQPYATNNYVYDVNNLMLASTDSLGNTSGFVYDYYGNLLTSTDASGNATTNNYDGQGNLISTIDVYGNTSSSFYSGGLMLGSVDASGTATTNSYDPTTDYLTGTATLDTSGNILSTNSFTYDANGNRLTSTVWRRVNSVWTPATTAYIYDAMNRVVQTIDPDGGTNTIVYNAIGKQQATIDKLGRITSFTYDAQGRLIQTTYPDLTTEASGYDVAGNRISSTDRAGRTTTYVYDALNRLTQTIYADNTTNTTVYDGVGRVAQTIDARDTITAFAYDVAGRRLAVTNAFGITGVQNVSTYAYDANGNQITFTDANSHATTNVFDALNRQVQVKYADGTSNSTGYDVVGRRVAETNQDGLVTRFGYDGAGRLVSVTNALQLVTRYQFDEAGNEIAQIDALNRTNAYLYDGMGRRISHALPGGQKEGFAYDGAGNLLWTTNFNGAVITNQYDVMNRMTNQSSVNGYRVGYAYTLTGQRLTMADASGLTSYGYDNRDRLVSKTVSWTNGPVVSLNYLYDANGGVTNIWSSTINGVNLAYGYDPLSRLTNVLANGDAAAGYGFDLTGNLQTIRYGNGVTNQYQYDSMNRLTNQVWKLNASTLASFYYQLGLTGNRTNLSEAVNGTSRTYAWKYDSLYRLTNENVTGTAPTGTLGYSYDAVGNRTVRTNITSGLGLANQTPAYNTNDWLKTDAYDSNGNTLWTTNGTVQGPYYYDVQNRLTNYGNSVYLVYDGDGNRVSKTVGGVTTYYLVDDRNPSGYAQVLEEWTASGGVTNLNRVYNYGLELVSQRSPGVSTNYLVYDGHGSTRMLTDNGGTFVNAFTYDAFGTLVASNSAPQTVYLYCGQQFDPDLGLYYNRARYLNPDTGRFWTMDSYAGNNKDPLSLHKYLYGADNPVNRIDALGKWATFIHKEAIDRALQTSVLPASDRQTLKEEQDEVDQDQKAVDSYRHAMSNGSSTPPQSAAEAQQEADQHVGDWLTKARATEAKNDHTAALQYLGQAMHALQDSTSPAHHGFQPWYDYPGGKANPHEWCHGAKESINPGQESWLYIATGEAYDYFHDTSKQLPSDFFNDLGADSTGTGIRRWFNPSINIIPDVNINFTIGDIGGFAF